MHLREAYDNLREEFKQSERDLRRCEGIIRSYIPHIRRQNELMENALQSIYYLKDIKRIRDLAKTTLDSIKVSNDERAERIQKEAARLVY